MRAHPNIGDGFDTGGAISSAEQELLHRAYQLPRLLLPMAERLAEDQPDFILACDRNARPIGRALEAIFKIQGQPIPSIDQTVHYRKVTANTPAQTLRAHLAPLFAHMEEKSHEVPYNLAIIDDHVRNGDTMRAFNRASAAANLAARTTWMTVTGRGADFVVRPHVGPGVLMPWRDRPDVLGIDYTPQLEVQDTRSERSNRFYAEIAIGAAALAADPATMG